MATKSTRQAINQADLTAVQEALENLSDVQLEAMQALLAQGEFSDFQAQYIGPGLIDWGVILQPPDAPPPAPPPGMPTDLRGALTDIPVAHAGQVITEEFHNSLRAAVLAISSYLGEAVVSRQTVLSFAPSLFPSGRVESNPTWEISQQAAMAPNEGGDATGWMPVSLPDGARIQGLTVEGKRPGEVGALDIQLIRYELDDPNQTPLILSSVSMLGEEPWQAPVSVQGAGPSALEEYKIVDNAKHRFVVTAELSGASEVSSATGNVPAAQINVIRISCTRF